MMKKKEKLHHSLTGNRCTLVSRVYLYLYSIVADTIPLLHMVFDRWCCLQCNMKYYVCTTPTISLLLKWKRIEKKKVASCFQCTKCARVLQVASRLRRTYKLQCGIMSYESSNIPIPIPITERLQDSILNYLM